MQQQAKTKRIICFDIARGIALACMVFVHILFAMSKPILIATAFGQAIIALANLLTASVFMFLMGTNLALSQKTTIITALKRGLLLLIAGYALNLLRGVIPVWVGIQADQFTLRDIAPETPLTLFKEVDILQWAGISLICIAIVKRFLNFPFIGIVAGLFLLVSAPLFYGYEVDFPLLGYATELFWGTNQYVFFPVFPWVAYALFGLSYGYCYQKQENKPQFFKVAFNLGGVLFVSGMVLLFRDAAFTFEGWLNGEYLQGVIPAELVIFQTGFILIWLSICHQLIHSVPFNPIFELLCYWSRNVTVFYFIQWVLIGWVVIFRQKLGVESTVFYILVILFLTHILIYIWTKLRPVVKRIRSSHA